MSNPLTKYLAASVLAGAVMFGGIAVAGAQDDADATTTTEQEATTPDASADESVPAPDSSDDTAKEGCDGAKGERHGPGGPGGRAPSDDEAPADAGATAESSLSTT